MLPAFSGPLYLGCHKHGMMDAGMVSQIFKLVDAGAWRGGESIVHL